MTLSIYAFPPSPRSFKVLALLGHIGLEHELRLVDLSKGEHRGQVYQVINPNQRVPALDDDGFTMWEANAMLQYLALKHPQSGLMPEDPKQRARVLQWQCWDLAHWEPSCTPIIYERCVKPLLQLGEADARAVEAALAAFANVAKVLDAQLSKHEFVIGNELTVADFSLGAVLNVSDAAGIPVQDYPNIRRWHRRLTQLPAWRTAMIGPFCNRPHFDSAAA